MRITDRVMLGLKHGWNVFRSGRDPAPMTRGIGSTYRPSTRRYVIGGEKTIITSIYNQLANDVASIDIRHVKNDEDGNFLKEVPSSLNNLFKLEANIDQNGIEFLHDIAFSTFDEGAVAVVPVDTDTRPNPITKYTIETARVGQIMQWYPKHVTVRLYNDNTGLMEDVLVEKRNAAIITNPMAAVMNEPNSLVKRLVNKLQILDVVDEQSGSGKLDIIIQLPYAVRGASKKQQAEDRRKEIEAQMVGSQYGVAYIDGTEKVTQLNRPAENNLMAQVQYLNQQLYNQLGLTESVFDGSADEATMLNYYNRSIYPIVRLICLEFTRKFLTKQARGTGNAFRYFRDPFANVPMAQLADSVDKFTRNEIMSSNEVRAKLGMKPAKDPRADKLENKNISHPDEKKDEETPPVDTKKGEPNEV